MTDVKSTTEQLLDKYALACSLTSDNQLAAALGIKRQSVHQWRKGQAFPSEEHIYTMAMMIDNEPTKWLVAIHADRSSGPVKKEWVQLAKSLGYAAAAVTFTVGLAVQTPAKASTVSAHNFAEIPGPVYYV
jgi:transcriptional regulator with XRE-family HTH domain